MKKLLAILLCLLASPAFAFPFTIGQPITSAQNSTAAGSLILKAAAGYLNGFSATSGSTAGYLLVFDSATVPADGTVTPKFCYQLPAETTIAGSWNPNPAEFNSGIVLVFSSTGCFTKTISNTAFFSGQIQ